ncbi:MAG: flavodoxin family protein [Spirochaetota bacterium]
MRVLGLYGSPRKHGNTDRLHDMLLNELGERGAEVKRLRIHDIDVKPCFEYTACEKTGHCPIEDDMETTVIPSIRKADLVTVSTPVFFYGVTAGLKALIDRSQILWARKNRLGLRDPAAHRRRGFLLSAGATNGEQLFTGIRLTVEYFFDAISAEYSGDLVYRSVEGRGDIEEIATLHEEVRAAAESLFQPPRRRILVASPRSGASALAAAAALREAAESGDDIASLGPVPGPEERRDLESAAGEMGLDLFSQTLDYTIEDGGTGLPEEVPDGASDGWAPQNFDFTVVLGNGEDLHRRITLLIDAYGISGGTVTSWNPPSQGEKFFSGCRKAASGFLDSLGRQS